MGISISGSNSISGLGGNDTDFDKVLSQLKKIEETQLNRLEAWKSDWNLRYQAFTQIIEQIQAASSMLSQLSDKNNFVTKLVQSTNESIVTAVANASAQDVQHTISVSQMASNAIWANTGHVFDSKTDVINTTGTAQDFSYTYAGKRYDFSVPANTTLESFASMINNSASNPGIKVSIVSTGNGYVFQVAGKSTGAANDLIIHDSNLVGMKAADDAKSTWVTNSAININESVTNPTSYVFDLVLQGGATKSVTVKGDSTPQELVAALNNAAGGISASVADDGTLTIKGVQSFSRRTVSDDAYKAGSITIEMDGGLTDDSGADLKLNSTGGIAEGVADGRKIKFTITLDNGETREVELNADATRRDFYKALNQAVDGSNGSATIADGKYSTTLKGVTGLTFEAVDPADTLADSKLTITQNAASGTKDALGSTLTSATTTLTFDTDKLGKRIDGKTDGDGEALEFTVVLQDGTAIKIPDPNLGLTPDLTSDLTNEQLRDRIFNELDALGITVNTVTVDGKETLKIDGVKDFYVSSGPNNLSGYSKGLESTVTIPATNPGGNELFYTDPADSSKKTLEKAPDLVYTVTTNDGKTGTLTLGSGTGMKDIIAALKNTSASGWEWKDAAGTVIPSGDSAIPDSLGLTFVDAKGNAYATQDADAIDGPIYLRFDNVKEVSGIEGQVATSSNWAIQRAANARYKIDNWPVEMESETNTIGDVIEGVVFTIQDEGQARIAVSTDITSVEQSIQNFLDAVNSVLLTVNDLMKYDDTKEITSNDPNDIGNDNYSASGLTNQKGSLLTGNYGVQLFKSRFSSVLSQSPPGFKSMQSADDLLSGDLLASLANLGIKTDTDSTSDTYGMLVLAPSSSIAALQSMDKENYNDMITNHLEAVVDFFCTSGTGSSTSTDFRYGSHVEGITKAGSYEVQYTVNNDGTIAKVTVGGVEAKRDESQPGNYYSVASGDAKGLSLLIDDLTPGSHPPAGEGPMYVRIKEGLVQTTNNFLKGELVFNDVSIGVNDTPEQIADAIHLKSQNGALMSLRDNYKSVMESIDVKIEREQRRIDTWYSRQKAIFANLETLLKQYEQQQTSLESQLKQLSGSKS